MQALSRLHPEAEFELVSHGAALERYRALAQAKGLVLKLVETKPDNYWRATLLRIRALRGSVRLAQLLGFRASFHYVVPKHILDNCDVLWFPWIHRHRLAKPATAPVVGSLHDTIHVHFENIIPKRHRADERETLHQWLASAARIVASSNGADERETLHQWLASAARIVVSSNATVATVTKSFQVSPERFSVIPVSGEHAKVSTVGELPSSWDWSMKPFLICPSNVAPHKNHEVLLEGVAAWGAKYPLVLTGEGADLLPPELGRRTGTIRRLAKAKGFEIGSSLIPLGYVSNEAYFGLLSRSWALIMPTLAEGGGSFPVYEAMMHGVPVVCSDIPVIREQILRTGGEVMWFNPHDPLDLAEKLNELEGDYQNHKERAKMYAGELNHRSWEDVASEYWSIFVSVAKGAG
jgi:glycosyltransferase involved in cell wall biosynthesis